VSSDQVCVNPDLAHQLKWYYWHRLPLLPDWRYRPGDGKWNTWGFYFHWLIFRAWTMDSPDIGFEVTLDDQQLQIRARFPYLITGLFIPLFPQSWMHKLWRRP
jgi:hypothetical protein